MIPTFIVVGVKAWERYTKPCLESIKKHMPECEVVCVDNGSFYPDMDGVQMVRTDEVVCYAAGINAGLQGAYYNDWYLILNNDILIEKPFDIRHFEADNLYGFITYDFKSYKYLAGWGLFIPDNALDDIGYFDENLKPMWFEDADYCIRAQKAGYGLVTLDRKAYGVRHFEDENMTERKAYMSKNMRQRRINRQFIERKHDL